jgi:hypothetical protein
MRGPSPTSRKSFVVAKLGLDDGDVDVDASVDA